MLTQGAGLTQRYAADTSALWREGCCPTRHSYLDAVICLAAEFEFALADLAYIRPWRTTPVGSRAACWKWQGAPFIERPYARWIQFGNVLVTPGTLLGRQGYWMAAHEDRPGSHATLILLPSIFGLMLGLNNENPAIGMLPTKVQGLRRASQEIQFPS